MSSEQLFRPTLSYGEPHPKNGSPGRKRSHLKLYYFCIESVNEPLDAFGDYITPESFDWLARRLGMPLLERNHPIQTGESES